MFYYISVILYVLTFYEVSAYYHEGDTGSLDELPDTDQIRLIDGGPLWNSVPEDVLITTRRPTTSAEHRSLKSPFKKTKFKTQNDEVEQEQTSDSNTKELNEFLRSYAEKVRRTKKPTTTTTEEPEMDSFERFHKVELVTKPSDEPTNRLANLLLGDKYKENKLKGWKKKPQVQPDDDKKGWVSLEVVPWSVSKVAKWHSSAIKQASEERPRPDFHVSTIPGWNYPIPKPMVTYNPSSSYNSMGNNYKHKPFNYGQESYTRPFDTTQITTPEKVYIQQEYVDEVSKPWNKPSQFLYAQYENNNNGDNDEDEDLSNEYGGIITDGLPSNFPGSHRPNYNRRKGTQGDSEHPITHPFSGDGEWVLLTTTKGYKGSGRQRSIDIDAIPEEDVESIKSHKSVRLTVLPPLNGSKVNMTTSHGGLLQVESTFETVDEAQRLSEKNENMKKSPLKTKQLKKPMKQIEASTVAPSTGGKFKFPAPSSVLAAVGAGMIPATMAMLVPMAMGRRRKRETFDQPQMLRFPLPIQLRHTY